MLRWGASRMNWAWATSLDQFWRSPVFPMWLTLAAAGFVGIILVTMLLRPERSVANGTVTVIITVLALGIATAASFRGFGPAAGSASETIASAQPPTNAALPALSCIDDLAGDTVRYPVAAYGPAIIGRGRLPPGPPRLPSTPRSDSHRASECSRVG